MTKTISVLLVFTLIPLSTGCAGLAIQQPLAFRGTPVGVASDPSPGALSGGGTIGIAGGLLIDEFEKNWAQFKSR